MTAEDLIALNEQIAAMARAGLPLDQGLLSLAKDMSRGRLRKVTEAIAEDLRAGHPLPEALARRGKDLPPYYSNLVVAGIHTGRLPEVLTTLTTYARTVSMTRTTVIEALFYPGLVFIVALGIMGALSFLILPQIDSVFNEFGLQLPALTKLVLQFGRHPVELIVIPSAILIFGLIAFRLLAQFTEWGRRKWNRIVDLTPLVGTLLRAARLAAFADLLGMLVDYGVPLPAAFRLAGATSGDKEMTIRANEVEERLSQGHPLADALHGQRLLPDWVVWLAAEGEKKGSLAPSFREIASVYRRQVDNRSAILKTVLPPFLVIATAGVLSTIFILAIMMPLVNLLEGLSK